MSDRLLPGPYQYVDLGGGASAPFYIIPFDEVGRRSGPRTAGHLIKSLENGDYTDVFLFSHGWNNDWDDAQRHYEKFIQGYGGMRRGRTPKADREYRPILVGVFWPSIALVLPWEESLQIAGAKPDGAGIAEERRETEEIARALLADQVESFYDLVQRPELKNDEALRLADLIAPLLSTEHDETPLASSESPTAQELVSIWWAAQGGGDEDDGSGDYGLADDEDDNLPPAPQAAGLAKYLDPRWLVRIATVRRMKDRAGVVGSRGVGPLLKDMMNAAPGARFRLIGHSYGAKVMLSAVCHSPPPRKVDSVLLLQPAVNYLCFAKNIRGQAGGYRSALDRVEQPIMTTFSSRDAPLTQLFHLALRRESDLLEVRIAGAPVPSWYAALGGYGPGGVDGEVQVIRPMLADPDRYDLGPRAPRICAIDGSTTIRGHGDISNESTWWALYNQVNHRSTVPHASSAKPRSGERIQGA